jgi:hypothetical protein
MVCARIGELLGEAHTLFRSDLHLLVWEDSPR